MTFSFAVAHVNTHANRTVPLLSPTGQQQQQPAAAQQKQRTNTHTTTTNVEDSLEESTASDAPHGESHNNEEEVTCQCQFCGKYDASFTDEKLDMHYWQSCPMLMGCAECGQVIEISALPEHLLDECQVRFFLRTFQIAQLQLVFVRCVGLL